MFVMGARAIVVKIQHHRHWATAATALTQGEIQGSLRMSNVQGCTRTFSLSMFGSRRHYLPSWSCDHKDMTRAQMRRALKLLLRHIKVPTHSFPVLFLWHRDSGVEGTV